MRTVSLRIVTGKMRGGEHMNNRMIPYMGIQERRMCGTKVRHSTKEVAELAKKDMLKKDITAVFNVYQCKYCHYWHIGNDKRSQIVR